MSIYPELQKNPLLHVCITEPLRRGTARMLWENPRGAVAFDAPSGLLLLAADDPDAAAELLSRAEGQVEVRFILLSSAAFEPLIERFHLSGRMRCHQAALFSGAIPPEDSRLIVAPPDAAALERIIDTYRMDTPEEIRRRAQRGELFFARNREGADVGFVGLHPEGCFGLLEVFPEQRGRGYGAALEAHILRFCRDTGRIPYCQVEENNLPSLSLQRKLGLRISPETLLMAWNPDE